MTTNHPPIEPDLYLKTILGHWEAVILDGKTVGIPVVTSDHHVIAVLPVQVRASRFRG